MNPRPYSARFQRWAFKLLQGIGLLSLISVVQAGAYPDKPIRLIVPYAAGGATDMVARSLASRMSDKLGQPVVVDNRPGGNSAIGTGELAKARPDGYTFGMILSAHVVNPFVNTLPFDPVKDFEPVSYVARMPGVLVVNPSVTANSVGALLTEIRNKPKSFLYAIPGGLTNGHVTMEMFKLDTQADIQGVMYRGGAPATLDVAGGQVQMMIISPTAVLPFVQSGKLRALATTGEKGIPPFEKLPTLKDSGFPNLVTYEWVGMLAPAGTPGTVIRAVQESVDFALSQPEVVKTLGDSGMEIIGGGPDALKSQMERELDRLRSLTQKVKLTGS